MIEKLHMKYSLFFSFLILASAGFSQAYQPALTQSNEFNVFLKAGGGGTAAFKTSLASEDGTSQFFLPDWESGEVITINNQIFYDGLVFAYDKVRQELFIRKKDSSDILTGNKEEIKSFSLKDGNQGQYHFINSKMYTAKKPEVYYQQLVYDSAKLSLLKLNSCTFVRADPTDMMKQKQGAAKDAFVDSYSYYIVKGNNEPHPVQLKNKSVKKTLTDLNVSPDAYLNEHPGQIDEDYLIAMIKKLNQ